MSNECQYCDFYSREIEKLKQENEKLKKGLGFYAKFESYNVHRNKGLTQEIRVLPMSDCDKFNDCGYKLILGGKLARITLKEIEESK